MQHSSSISPSLDQEIFQSLARATSPQELEEVRVNVLGKKGLLTLELQKLGQLPHEERKERGLALNRLRDCFQESWREREIVLKTQDLHARLAQERVDVTLPARPMVLGKLHPIPETIAELTQIFARLGFSVAEGPDIEDDFHNFEALNFPIAHPAREMHDTFYLATPFETGETPLLRTHTSPVQIRFMLKQKPPFRVIIPGRTYRSDFDATHTPMFHQLEGLVIDEKTHMGHLKSCLTQFCRTYFENESIDLRFRPSFFPFTEPSAEVDIRCSRAGGKLKLGQGDDWLEILGAGMVHPTVLKHGGLDPDRYQGFAFGMGVERVAMLKHGIPDLRTFFESDWRWLQHYGFSPLAD